MITSNENQAAGVHSYEASCNGVHAATVYPGKPPRDPTVAAYFGGLPDNAAGVFVNEFTALNYSAVFAAVRLLSETIASFPCGIYEGHPLDPASEPVPDHPLQAVIDNPSQDMTAMVFTETNQAHTLTWGNGCAEILRTVGGSPIGMEPITPERITPDRDDDGIFYRIRSNSGGDRIIRGEDMLHVPGLGFDGMWGYSPVRMASESIGLGLGTERYGAGFFGNGARPGGVLTFPGTLNDKALKQLKEDWGRGHAGPANSQRVAVLDRGLTWQALGIPPEEAQFLETRMFQIVEVARWFNVPPHLLRDLSRATFSNIENQGLEFVIYSLRPWLIRREQEMARKLLSPAERGKFFFKYNVDSLLMGDRKSRYEAYAIGRQWGWLSADDVCNMEGRPGLPSGQGKVYLIPANMMAADTIYDEPDPVAAPAVPPASPTKPDDAAAEAQKQKIFAAQRALFVDVLGRMTRKEAAAARRAAGKPAAFIEWLDSFYESHETTLQAALLPAMHLRIALTGKNEDPQATSAAVARHVCQESQYELLELYETKAAGELAPFVDRAVERWEIDRPYILANAILGPMPAPKH